MNEETYVNTQQQVLLLAQLLKELPLNEFVDAIDRAETLGPILNPTLFMRAGVTMGRIGDIAAALRRAQQKIIPILKELEPPNDHTHPTR